VRKTPAILAVLGLSMLALAGCSVPVPGADCAPPATADTQLKSQVTVTGPFGSAPQVSIGAPLHAAAQSSWVIHQGKGTAVTTGSQLVVLDITLYSGSTGRKLVGTGYTGDLSQVFAVKQLQGAFPQWNEAMHCARAGSRIVVALPPKGISAGARSSFGLGDADSAVAVVDLQKVYLPRAAGGLEFNDARDMPTVVRAPNGRPGIIVPSAAAPKSITVQTLIRGAGRAVTAQDTVRVAFTGVNWTAPQTVFKTTWNAGPASVALGSTDLPGFAQALTGKTVGSQVLVVVPKSKVGTPSDGSIPVDDALVFVIDILGIDTPAANG